MFVWRGCCLDQHYQTGPSAAQCFERVDQRLLRSSSPENTSPTLRDSCGGEDYWLSTLQPGHESRNAPIGLTNHCSDRFYRTLAKHLSGASSTVKISPQIAIIQYPVSVTFIHHSTRHFIHVLFSLSTSTPSTRSPTQHPILPPRTPSQPRHTQHLFPLLPPHTTPIDLLPIKPH